MILPVGFGSSAGGTPANAVENSLRFNSADSAYLNRTPTSVSADRTRFTFSCWLKRGSLTDSGVSLRLPLFGAGPSSGQYTQIATANGSGDLKIELLHDGALKYSTLAVLRDPSAWCNLVVQGNSNETVTNRIKIWVNNVQYTTSVVSEITSGDVFEFGNTVAHYVGKFSWANYYFDGYLTEINFIDGQALTPSDFGETDTNTGVWKPKAYTGSYGTNGFYLPMSAGTTWSGYFDGSNDYLSVASNAAWQYGTGDFTVECWLLGTSSGALSNQYPLGRYNTSAGAYGALQIGNSTTIYWYYGNGAAYTFTLGTALTTNQWYHFAVSRSGTSLRFFLNGTQVGSTQTDSTNYSGTAEFRIVNAHQTSATYFPGYISNVRVVKGSAVYTANFTPSTTPLTAITNTVLLTCQSSTFIDNSTNNFTITNNGGAITQLFSPFNYDATDDQSGNGNNWQPNNLNLVTTGVGADSLVDTPTSYGTDTGVGGEVRGNYCTLNPLASGTNTTLANGALDFSCGTTQFSTSVATLGLKGGKWYWEVTATSNGIAVGIMSSNANLAPSALNLAGPGESVNGWHYQYNAFRITNNTAVSYGATFSTNDVIGIALDLDAGTIVFYKNGTSQGTAYSGLSTSLSYFPAVGDGTSGVAASCSCNFGQRAFAYTAPSGFKALCTQNLPTPTIGATSTTQANDYFNAILYNGNGNTGQTITGVGFQPDWVWLKNRNTTGGYYHCLFDAVRGAGYRLKSNSTDAEVNASAIFSAFTSDGFTFPAGQGNTIENDGNPVGNYVAWNWKANGAGSSNTDGQITSTVSANNDAGFSIVTYTGNGSANQTVGHGCKVGGVATAPAFGILKDRDPNSNNSQWQVFHTGAGDKYGYLSTTAAFAGTAEFYPTSGSSTTVTIARTGGVIATTNESGDRFVMYLFAPVAGYSAFSSYTGNAAADGPFIYTGFRPEYVLIKASTSSGDWIIEDAVRSPYNVSTNYLVANTTGTETTGQLIDFLSNGFKIRVAVSSAINGSGTTYIYAAFAENPFKYSLAR